VRTITYGKLKLLLAKAAHERRADMKKKLKTEMKKLRISKEILLPLESRQMRGVAGGSGTSILHFENTQMIHIG
jgi:hypothetical protein